ncbi:hypothetical protein CDV31_002685 [Fusarium ambrosium]|uniref:Zn(2)-C6 fungal-type domain-containing protein n=1 Tax=Fusarium ambrosium TaxID=131363 RepID=A0A428UW78_9HYPO|nr:hypothetical protein CDV31_002685 [Fusarium ambrosium]
MQQARSTRAGYKKSRNGCARCKKRRVKCDEEVPCSACYEPGQFLYLPGSVLLIKWAYINMKVNKTGDKYEPRPVLASGGYHRLNIITHHCTLKSTSLTPIPQLLGNNFLIPL